MFHNIASDVRFALRWLRRSPGFAAIAIGSLALGIGFNAALFTIVDALLFRPLPVERPDRLADVFSSSNDGDQYATSSYPDYQDFKARNEVFSDMLAYSPAIAAVTLTDRPRLAMGETVTGNYFQLLGVHAAVGRTLLPEDDRAGAPRAVMISHKLWRREFGAERAAVGQSIRIHGQLYTIVGVAPADFTGMVRLIAPEVWMPIELKPAATKKLRRPGASPRIQRPSGVKLSGPLKNVCSPMRFRIGSRSDASSSSRAR